MRKFILFFLDSRNVVSSNKSYIHSYLLEMISARIKSPDVRPLLQNEYQNSSTDIFHGLTFPEVPTAPIIINNFKTQTQTKTKPDATSSLSDDQGYVALTDHFYSNEKARDLDDVSFT